MTSDESVRIATLTTGAIRESAKKVTEQIRAAVAAAEKRTEDLRKEAELMIKEFEQRTDALADNINGHILICQETIDKFKERSTITLDPPQGNPDVPAADEPDELKALVRRVRESA